jgi:quercetin dioxygenase-like cupin family protein
LLVDNWSGSLYRKEYFTICDSRREGENAMSKHEAATPAAMTDGIHRAADGAIHRWWFGALATIRLRGADTGGRFSYVEMLYPPGLPVFSHVHHDADEIFQVLEGAIQYRVGNLRCVATPGSVVVAPRGVPHEFIVVGERPARYLITYTPAGFEEFMIESSEAAPSLTLPPPPSGPPPADLVAHFDRRMADIYRTEWCAAWPEPASAAAG